MKGRQGKSKGWAKNPGLFLRGENFATISGSKACDMSNVCT